MKENLSLDEIKVLLEELKSEKFGYEQLEEKHRGTDEGNYFEGRIHGLEFAIIALKELAQI